MTTNAGSGLARITVAAPRRRIDVALPDGIVVADLLPAVLRASGDATADDGQRHGGWVLRREDGRILDATRTLSAQDVRDGEILHFSQRQTEWPELDYDDVVDAIASSARGRGRAWAGAMTRRAGIATSFLALLLGPALVMLGSASTTAGVTLLAVAAVLLVVALGLSRAFGDAGAGAAVGAAAMFHAALGGAIVLNHDRPLSEIGTSQIMVGAACLVGAAAFAYWIVGNHTQYFAAGVTIGLLALLGAAAARLWTLSSVDAAAVMSAIIVTFTPAFPLLSIRLGKLPVPGLPTTAEELLADPPHPPLSRVHATVRRSDEILQGLFIGSSIVLTYCELCLARGNTTAVILLAIVATVTLLRARLFPAVSHRLPLLVCGAIGLALVAIGLIDRLADGSIVVMVVALTAVALVLLGLSLYFQRAKPSPLFGRIADIMDVMLMLAVVPMMCLVVGLFGYIRGLAG